jgi:uncharacterized protein with PIN domain
LRFVADGMLGKLSRWLRIMGHDVEYSNSMNDVELLTTAKAEGRILLTRDFGLYQHAVAKGVDAFYVAGQTEEERLAELAWRFSIKLQVDMSKSRCPKCNKSVKPVPKEKVAGAVEKSTFEHYSEFWECPKCGQIYWQGAHWVNIRGILMAAEENLQRLRKGGD